MSKWFAKIGDGISRIFPRMGSFHSIRSVCAFALAAITTVVLFSCARVDPHSDFSSASQSIISRNGVIDAYDPEADALVEGKVKALLENGLTIDEAVSVALLNNPAFQSLFHTIGASRADVVQSGLLSNPTLFFSARFPDAGGRSSLNFSFAQQLVDLWQIPIRKQIAEADLESTIANVLDRGVQLAAETRSQCIHVLALEQAEQITNENLSLTERALKLAQVRLDAGEADPIDANLVRSHVFGVQQILIAVRRDRRVAELNLAALLGLIRWPVTWELHGTLGSVGANTWGASELVEYACENRYDIRFVASQVDAAEAQLEREYLEIFPNVTLGLEAERKDSRALPGRKILADTARASVAAGTLTSPSIQSKGQRDLIRRQIVDSLLGPSFQLTLPIWDQNQAQIAKTRYQVIQLQKEYESVLDRAAREVKQAQIAAAAAQELVVFFEAKALTQATENLDIIRSQYESGEQGIIILIEAQEFLLQQSRAHVDALRAYAIAEAELQRAVGGRLPTISTTQPTATQPSLTMEQYGGPDDQ